MIARAFLLPCIILTALAACKAKDAEMESKTPEIQEASEQVDMNCKPATGIFDFLVHLGAFDDWSESPIKPLIIARFTPLDGKPVPSMLIYRFDGVDTKMPVNADSKILFNGSALDPDGGGELCIVDPARKNDPPGGLDFNLNIEFVFKQDDTGYPFKDLLEATRTTTEYFQRTLRAASGDDATHPYGAVEWVVVSKPEGFDGEWEPPNVTLLRGGTTVAQPMAEPGEKAIFISIESMRALNVDRLMIDEGSYKFAPTFDPAKLRDAHNSETDSQ